MRWAWLGQMPYRRTWELQERLRAAIVEGLGEETLLLCEHPEVITLGRSARLEHVLAPASELAARGIEVVATNRGGDVTYHGPGQLVGYPVFRVRSVIAHVRGMADALISVCAKLGVHARWRRDCPGVWVENDKLAAFGVHIRRGVAVHGFALNVTTSREAFSCIVPCGLAKAGVTSLAAHSAQGVTVADLAPAVAGAFAALRGESPTEVPARAIMEG